MNRFARALRKNATDAEKQLWNHLRGRRLAGFKFRRQRPFGPYVVDFVCLEARVVIELDGSQHLEQSAYDSRRDEFIRLYGFRVLRFWNADVTERAESVVDTIFEALHQPAMDGRFD